MCDDYVPNPELTKDTNAILKQLACNETRRQLGHCIVWSPTSGWNVPGVGAARALPGHHAAGSNLDPE